LYAGNNYTQSRKNVQNGIVISINKGLNHVYFKTFIWENVYEFIQIQVLLMNCPFCGSSELRTLETRDSPNNMNRRRKQCTSCDRRITTYEYIELVELMVQKKDGRLERFNLDKIIRGLQRAVEKRPISPEQVRDIAEKVRQSILSEGKEVIPSTEVGDMIMVHLKKLDYVAYVRFASVYREFKEPEDFEKLMKEG